MQPYLRTLIQMLVIEPEALSRANYVTLEPILGRYLDDVAGIGDAPSRWQELRVWLGESGVDPDEIDEILRGRFQLLQDMERDIRFAFSQGPTAVTVSGFNGREAERREAPTEPVHVQSWADLAEQIDQIEWLWQGWLPKGMVIVLAGSPGSGKSAVALWLARTLIQGGALPDGSIFKGETGKVLWIETEAAQPINVNRARDWGVPLNAMLNVPLPDEQQDVRLADESHRAAIARTAQRSDVKLIVLDSLSGATAGQGENKPEVMEYMLWLARLARDVRKPIIVVHHVTKPDRRAVADIVTLPRVRGHGGIVQPARVVWALEVPDLARPDIRRLRVIKSNLAALPEPLGVIVGSDGVSFVDAPGEYESKAPKDKATEFLLNALADGPVPSRQLQEGAENAGINWRTAERAKSKLPIDVTRPKGIWHWGLRRA